MKEPGAGAVSCLHLMLAPLEQEIPDYQSGRYYGSDAVRSPLHRCTNCSNMLQGWKTMLQCLFCYRYRGPGEPPYTGEFP